MSPDHLHHLRAESVRFLDAIRQTEPDARVPTCPDWTADDLLWHLGGEVQWFWASIIADNLRDLQQIIDLVEIDRPTGRDALLALFTEESARLHRVASETDPTEPRWMWVSDSSLQHVGYITRRQAHEALIHRIDAELTAGSGLSPIDPELAADGVDEAIRIMHGNHPEWGSFAVGDATVRLGCTDTGEAWVVELGRFTGTDSDGDAVDTTSWRPLAADDGREVSATITADAADLDLWLWSRPTTKSPVFEGDSDALGSAQAIVGDGVD